MSQLASWIYGNLISWLGFSNWVSLQIAVFERFDSAPSGTNKHCTYQNRVHPHVDSADADQDAPAERHAEA